MKIQLFTEGGGERKKKEGLPFFFCERREKPYSGMFWGLSITGGGLRKGMLCTFSHSGGGEG